MIRASVPIVSESFLHECIAAGQPLDPAAFILSDPED
jgi:hypothetical protein